jgi:hypothetical protein
MEDYHGRNDWNWRWTAAMRVHQPKSVIIAERSVYAASSLGFCNPRAVQDRNGPGAIPIRGGAALGLD